MDWAIVLKGKCLEYYEADHTYLVDGVIVPSVSEVLDMGFGRKYVSVDPAVLKRAADRGIRVHEAIERFCKTGEEEPIDEVRNFKFLQNKYGFSVVCNELPILIDYDGLTVAGRLDMVIRQDGKLGGADVKNTSSFDKERTALQLNLYRIGYKQCYGESWDFITGIHLKGDTRRYIGLPVDEKYAYNYLEEFKHERCGNDW